MQASGTPGGIPQGPTAVMFYPSESESEVEGVSESASSVGRVAAGRHGEEESKRAEEGDAVAQGEERRDGEQENMGELQG